jgi:hypothetical protein
MTTVLIDGFTAEQANKRLKTLQPLAGQMLLDIEVAMKAKRGCRLQKGLWNIGNWLKRYWAKRTCRKQRAEILAEFDMVLGFTARETMAAMASDRGMIDDDELARIFLTEEKKRKIKLDELSKKWRSINEKNNKEN